MWASSDVAAGAHDNSKAQIQAAIEEGKANGGYHTLSEAKQDLLIKALQCHRNEIELSETNRPSVPLHDMHTTFNMINREVCCIVIIYYYYLDPNFLAREHPSEEWHRIYSLCRPEF
jgi:hypothetical protein